MNNRHHRILAEIDSRVLEGLAKPTVVSAGRVYLEEGKIVASGASSSLEVTSRDEDSEIIQSYLNEQSVIQQEHSSET